MWKPNLEMTCTQTEMVSNSNWILGHFRFWYYEPDEAWWSSNIISEYAGILLQMKMRASASLILKRKPMAPAKPINNLNNEVRIKL